MCLDWALKLLTSGSTPPPPPPLHPLRIQSSQPASVSQGPALCPETTPGFRCVTAPASFVGVGKQALSRVYPPFELTTSGSTLTGGTSIPPNPVELASVRYRCISRVIGGFHDRLSTQRQRTAFADRYLPSYFYLYAYTYLLLNLPYLPMGGNPFLGHAVDSAVSCIFILVL
ncbi:hypothetical protein GGS24DRAFT_459850 [Hypoxylon argillaceum]|nr:hypothetical protein GGS24DRAFT_459850 [Hypoxylon argillaceum]